jgi:hypothetical protein
VDKDMNGRETGPFALPSKGFIAVVMLIAVIVVAVGVPNLYEGSVRSAVSRTKMDMRSLSSALNAYYEDHKAFPSSCPLAGFSPYVQELKKAGGERLVTIEPGSARRAGLTTPVAYIVSLFEDWDSPQHDFPFAYHADANGWILVSPGPDRKYEIDPAADYTSSITQPAVRLLLKTYDPTNGTRSGGDIWRIR